MSEDKEDHAMPEDHTESNYIRRQEYLRKQRLKRRRRNRMIIVGTGIVILVILILIIVGLVRGCSAGSGEKERRSRPTDATTAAVNAKPTEPVTQPNVKEIKDNGEDGRMSDGSIFIWDNKGFELFFGGDDSAKEYADKINDYKKAAWQRYYRLRYGRPKPYGVRPAGTLERKAPERREHAFPAPEHLGNLQGHFQGYQGGRYLRRIKPA